MEQVISTHRTSCQSGWPRGFSCLNPSPYSWIFTSVSFRFQSSLLLIPEYPFTLHQSVAQNLSDMWRSTIEIGAEQIRSVTEIAPKSPFSCVNRIPVRYGFRTDAKAIRHSMNTYQICDSSLYRSDWRSFTPSQKFAPKSPFPCVNRSPSRYGFRTDGKAILYSVNIALKYSSMFNL